MALFTNIIHEEGMSCMREGLQKRKEPAVPTDFLMQLIHVILFNNIFEFHKSYYKLNVGAAMGGRPVPHYANIFMSSIDKNIKQLDIMQLLLLFKRFLDDYFIIWKGTSKQLHAFFVEIYSIHPSIKLTMSHTTRET